VKGTWIREEIKIQHQKAEKRKDKVSKHKYRFSVLTSKRKSLSEALVKYTME